MKPKQTSQNIFTYKKGLFNVRTKLSSNKYFSVNLLAIEIRRMWILMNKPVFVGLSALQIMKTVMYEFWHDYLKKKKYREKAKLLYMDTASFIVSIYVGTRVGSSS